MAYQRIASEIFSFVALQLICICLVAVQASLSVDVSGCGSTKGCFREPSDCTDCEMVATWKKTGDSVDFELQAKLGSADIWTAVGFSTNEHMGGSSVIDCVYKEDDGSVMVQMSYNDGESNAVLADKHLSLSQSSIDGTYADGRITCRFSRSISVSDPSGPDSGKVFSMDDDFYLILGRGPGSRAGVKRPHRVDPVLSASKVNVASGLTQTCDKTSCKSAASSSTAPHPGVLALVAIAAHRTALRVV